MHEQAVTRRVLYEQGPAGNNRRIYVLVVIDILALNVNLILVVIDYHIAKSLHLTPLLVIDDAVTCHAVLSAVLLNDRTVQQHCIVILGVEPAVTGIDHIALIHNRGRAVQECYMGVCVVVQRIGGKGIIRTLH